MFSFSSGSAMGLHVRSPYQRVHGWLVAAWRLSSPWVSVCGLSLEVKLCCPWLKLSVDGFLPEAQKSPVQVLCARARRWLEASMVSFGPF
ncbi:hypothetical protein YC2023_077263 [Brassica napus]